jgi:RNA polymerase sigma factor (sigma-70 family)
MTDKSLWTQYLAGSEEAFAELVQRHKNMVYGACLRLLRDPGEAEDAAQATFLLLVRKGPSLPGQTVLSGWLYHTALLVSRNAIKVRARRSRHEESAARLNEAIRKTPDVSWDDIRGALDTAMAGLPAAQRDALVLRYMHNRSVAEVAHETGDSEAAVAKRITRGLNYLRDLLRRKRLSVSTTAIGAYLVTAGAEAAPPGLTAAIQDICLGHAAASSAVAGMTQATLHSLLVARVRTAALAVLAVTLLAAGAGAASHMLWAPEPAYYIDYSNGRDDQDGRSPDRAFKHAPGDANATGQAAAVRVAPGDKLIFKGGVAYRGTVVIDAQGTAQAPVVYDGNTRGTFGSGAAVIDGGEPLGPWRRCASAEEAHGHPQWGSLYVAQVPAGFESVFALNLAQRDHGLRLAQEPNLEDPTFYERPKHFLSVEKTLLEREGADTKVPFALEKLPACANKTWENAFLLYPANSINMAYAQVKMADGRSLAVRGINLGKLPSTMRFSVMNALPLLDRPGEFVVDLVPNEAGRHTIWLWPPDATALDEVFYAMRANAFECKDAAHVVIDGFGIRRLGYGPRVYGISGSAQHLLVKGCDIAHLEQDTRSGKRGAAIELHDAKDVRLEGNQIRENIGAGVILSNCSDVEVSGNTFKRCGSTALDLYGCSDAVVVDNLITEHRPFSGNGITVARQCARVVIERNRLIDVKNALTLEDSETITVRRNVLSDGIFIWGGPLSGKVVIAHNVLLDGAIQIGSDTNSSGSHHTGMVLLVANNILPGVVRDANRRVFARAERTGNLYFRPNDGPRFKLDSSERIEPDLDRIFADVKNGVYKLRPDSPARDAGVDIASRCPVPDATPVMDGAPDIGAYEFEPEKQQR